MNKWIRQIHRWLVIPLMFAVVFSLAWGMTQGASVPLPAWAGGIGVVALLSLALTGLVMFAQHYWARWRRGKRKGETFAQLEGTSAR